MENPQRHDGQKVSFIPEFSQLFFSSDGQFRSGGDGSNRRILLCLSLLNVVLLIVAVVIGINCAKIREGSIHVSHSAATQLINKLNDLRSNHSDVIKAEEEAKNTLERAIKNHKQLKVQIEQQKTINDNHQREIEALQAEKTTLQSNMTALEGHCGRCLPKWSFFNSSCYFFSYTESTTVKKTWADSRADCISRHADLTVIDHPEEQTFVSEVIEDKKTSPKWWENGFWIGMTDIETEHKWVWINNVTEVEQRYWMDGEPNNHGGQGEDCGVAVASSSKPWKTRYDANCFWLLHWMCEMPSK